MMSFFRQLFDTSGFPPRWTCGQWSEGHGWLHILSDLAIFGAYMAIPMALAFFALRRKDVPFLPLFWLFALFIISCGLTHFIDATIFWHPWYRLSGLVKAITAVVSWTTVIALLQVLPRALALPALIKDHRHLTELVAQREQSEAALRESEERFHTLADNIPQLAWLADNEGRMEWVNRVWLDYTGTTLADNAGSGWKAVHHPDHVDAVTEKFERHLREGRDWEDTFPLRGQGGEYRWFLSRMKVIRNEAGKVARFFGTSTDITEIRQASEAVRNSEALYRAIGESINYGIWICAPDGRNTYASQSFLELIGVTQEQCADFGWGDVLHPDDAEQTLAAWNECVRTGGQWDREHRFRGVDGRWHHVLARGMPVKDEAGKVVKWAGINLDISRQKADEAALRRSERRFRAAVGTVSSLIWTNDAKGRMFGEQPGWGNFTGQTEAEYQGYGWAEAVHPEDAQPTIAAWEQAVAEKREFVFQHRLRRADGEWRLCSIRAVPMLDDEGAIAEWVGVHTDVTEQKRGEDILRERAADLAEADRRKDEFLAMLAHELRNPLAPLRNAAEILQTPESSATEQEVAHRILRRQIENMGRMIDDLLDASRITVGKITMHHQAVALEAVLTAAASATRQTCAAHRQQFDLRLPPQPVFLHGDATRLEQIFSNLLNNACKYSGDGSHIILSAEVVNAADGSPEVLIRVSDNGLGIEPALLPHVFDLFVQSTRSLDRAHGGLGIGLTLVQRLVELHGGRVEARSEGVGCGAEFLVHLPILPETPTPAPPTLAAPQPAVRETPRRLLIVDDNMDAARTLATLQHRRGHETRTAFTGPEAVAAAAEFLPEVVLLDIGLPGLNGFDVARQLRAMPALAGSFIVAMSGYGREEDRMEAKVAGFDEYLIKPVDLAKLSEWIRTRF